MKIVSSQAIFSFTQAPSTSPTDKRVKSAQHLHSTNEATGGPHRSLST